jgi:ribosomal-protein-alanine N-acetyltransferase
MPIDWRPPQLETPRLILRGIEESDADAVFAYASSPTISRYTLWDSHKDMNDTLEFVRDYASAGYLEKLPDPYAVCLKSDPDRVIGTLGASWAKRTNRTMELGYVLAEAYHGQGIMPEAARALLGHLFAAYDVERVQAHCMTPNVASARVMQKIGMMFEGTLRSSLFHRGAFWDMHLYSILRREFG